MRKTIIILGLMAASVLLIAVVGRDRSLIITFGPIEIKPVDFSTLELSLKPNQFLVCPDDYCLATPHMISPVFSVSVDVLRQRWVRMVEAQPRIETLSLNNPAMQYDYIQRTEWMRYPDSITVRFIDRQDGHSSIAIYSRSNYGHGDLGVNKDRIRAWLETLETSHL